MLKAKGSYLKAFHSILFISFGLLSIMSHQQQQITQRQLADLIRNKDRHFKSKDDKNYILFVCEEQQTVCILYGSDCCENIWKRNLDVDYFKNLKKKLNINSSIAVLAKHFADSLQSSSTINRIGSHLSVRIDLEIGQGLSMKCEITLENRVLYNNPQSFKAALQKYILRLYQVKCSQFQDLQSKHEVEQKEKEENDKLQEDIEKTRAQLFKDVKNRRFSLKNKDLVNPQRKKRKNAGAKFRMDFVQYVQKSASTQDVDNPQQFDI